MIAVAAAPRLVRSLRVAESQLGQCMDCPLGAAQQRDVARAKTVPAEALVGELVAPDRRVAVLRSVGQAAEQLGQSTGGRQVRELAVAAERKPRDRVIVRDAW